MGEPLGPGRTAGYEPVPASQAAGERPGPGRVVIFWPVRVAWLRQRGDIAIASDAFARLAAFAGRSRVSSAPMFARVLHDDDPLTPIELRRVDLGVVIGPRRRGEGDIGVRTIGGGEHAHVTVAGSERDLAAARAWLIRVGIPRLGVTRREGPVIEIPLHDPTIAAVPSRSKLTDVLIPSSPRRHRSAGTGGARGPRPPLAAGAPHRRRPMTQKRPVPEGFHTITPHLDVRGAADAIEFYKKAFGAEEIVRHARPRRQGSCTPRSASATRSSCWPTSSPRWAATRRKSLKGSPVTLHLYVDDADAAFERAVKAGAKRQHAAAGHVLGRPLRHSSTIRSATTGRSRTSSRTSRPRTSAKAPPSTSNNAWCLAPRRYSGDRCLAPPISTSVIPYITTPIRKSVS